MGIPDELYRVFDYSSESQYDDEYGFLAGNTRIQLKMFRPWDEEEEKELIDALHSHLDWNNTRPSPFISVHSSKRAAYACANGKINAGRRGVTIAFIDPYMLFEDQLRKVSKLADELEYEIPDAAYDNARCEWIVLHQIPNEAIMHLYCMN